MNLSLAITAIGEDRPGIVNELTEFLHSAHLNIEDSRMSILGGEFAIILLVSGDRAAIESVTQQKDSLESSLNLNLLIRKTASKSASDELISYKINVEGMDNPGIVHKLTRYLSQHSINIVNMQTSSSHAAHTGTPVFTVNMLVDIPVNKNIQQIQEEFGLLCDDLNMDADFSPA